MCPISLAEDLSFSWILTKTLHPLSLSLLQHHHPELLLLFVVLWPPPCPFFALLNRAPSFSFVFRNCACQVVIPSSCTCRCTYRTNSSSDREKNSAATTRPQDPISWEWLAISCLSSQLDQVSQIAVKYHHHIVPNHSFEAAGIRLEHLTFLWTTARHGGTFVTILHIRCASSSVLAGELVL